MTRTAEATIRRYLWKCVALGLGLLPLLLAAPKTEAHKAIASKYDYNEHVAPILRARCGSCHYEGGPTPMALTSYTDAVPWAQSVREQLMAEKMPPWFADPLGPAVQGGHTITTNEIDVVITWSVGGTPRGNPSTSLPPFEPPPREWSAGRPDLKIEMEADETVPAGTMEKTVDLTLPTKLRETKWVSAADLMPGNVSMVRDALISIDGGPMLTAWVPGPEPFPAPGGAAFKLPAGASLRVRMHYKKQWPDESKAMSDRSTVGLYFTDAPPSGRDVQSYSVAARREADESLQPRTFRRPITTAARIVGLRPSFDREYASVTVDAVLPAGERVTVLKLRSAQPQWYRRYWLQEPIDVPKGSVIEVTATPAPHDDFATAVVKQYPLQLDIDYVAK